MDIVGNVVINCSGMYITHCNNNSKICHETRKASTEKSWHHNPSINRLSVTWRTASHHRNALIESYLITQMKFHALKPIINYSFNGNNKTKFVYKKSALRLIIKVIIKFRDGSLFLTGCWSRNRIGSERRPRFSVSRARVNVIRSEHRSE